MVPMAELRRPLNGKASGERWHWALMLMRPTMVESASTSGAAAAPVGSEEKMAACWPFHEALAADTTSAASAKRATGITGPNCSSR